MKTLDSMKNPMNEQSSWSHNLMIGCAFILFFTLSFLPKDLSAQQYAGQSGLIHVQSADMYPAGDARIGAHFLNKEFMPDALKSQGKKYNSGCAYISVTPFSWIEVGYVFTLMKGAKVDLSHPEESGKIGFYHKDRYFWAKVRPIKEKKGEWWPSIALGIDDPMNGSGSEKTQHFRKFYVAMTKHVDIKGHRLGAHVVYRKWDRDSNHKWNGVVGGITYQPPFDHNLRFIAEYTGDDVNVGFDWKLWKHVLIQSSLQNGKYFSGGICFCLNLF